MELNGKKVNASSIEVDGVDMRDYPDFCDAYIDYAEYVDGAPLTDEELDLLQNQESDYVYELVLNKAIG
jgi:hypothetical protein